MQTLYARWKRGEFDLSWAQLVQLLMIDEAHLAAADLKRGNIFVRVSSLFTGANLRYGFTATPFMRDDYSNWLLEGVTGQEIYGVSARKLIDLGFLSEPDIEIIRIRGPKTVNSWPECYEHNIVLNSTRNKRIAEEAKTIPKPCLILVDEIAHGEIIQMNLSEQGMRGVPMLKGETPKPVRRARS